MGKAATAILTQAGAISGVAAVVCGLWIWNLAVAWGVAADRPDVATWSIRCFASATIACGQVIFIATVLPGFFGKPAARFGVVELMLMVAAALVALLTAVAGVAWAAAAGW